MFDQIRSRNKSIEEQNRAVEGNGSKMYGFENLKSVKGIGAEGAATLLSGIGDASDFRSGGQGRSFHLVHLPRLHNQSRQLRRQSRWDAARAG